MNMKKLFSLLLVMLAVAAQAQRVRIELTIEPAAVGEMKVYVLPLTVEGVEKATPLRAKDGLLVGTTAVSDKGLYNIVAVYDGRQLMSTVHIAATDEGNARLALAVEGNVLVLNDTPENRALSALNVAMAELDRVLWTQEGLCSDSIKAVVEGYCKASDSLLAGTQLSPSVAGYMKVWAYTRAYSAYTSIPRAQGIEASAVGFDIKDVLPAMPGVLDNEYAVLLTATPQLIARTIPSRIGLVERFEKLYGAYSNGAVRERVASQLVASFLSAHDYSADFEGGLEQLKQAVEKYGLPEGCVQDYIRRKATVVGSPFPAEVVLTDVDGNVVEFSSFKGKYVYIDMWASWCGPCCMEVPHLQALEKELENDAVVFVSISIDTDKEAWKNKMAELGMHGNQLHDRDGVLSRALNVRGIPFFMIYDKEGCLHTYGAMRPSRADVLKAQLEELE